MRIFIAALGTETNTFSPLPTGRRTFEETLLVRKDASRVSDNYFVLPMKAWRREAEARGDEIVESLSAFAQPAGRTVQSVWEELRDIVLADLSEAGPLDLILLNLHGAMASDLCDDCEGELVEMARAIVGPKITIGVELDLHCHLTERLLAHADAIVLYKEYPAIMRPDIARLVRRFDAAPAIAPRTLSVAALRETGAEDLAFIADFVAGAFRKEGALP